MRVADGVVAEKARGFFEPFEAEPRFLAFAFGEYLLAQNYIQ
jgi:hypothetical protein